MSTQTALGHSFPTPCKRCGGALYRQVDYCPYCGAAHPLDTAAPSRTAMPGSLGGAARLDNDPALADKADPTAVAAHRAQANRADVALRTSLVSSDMPMPPLEEPPYSTRRNRVTIRRVVLAVVAVVAIGLAYVVYSLFSDSSYSDDNNADQTSSSSNQDARTSTGTIAPFAPAPTAHSSDSVKPAAPGGSTNASNAANTATAANSTRTIAPLAAAPVAAPVKPAAPQFRDAALAVQAARLAAHANDLSTAQAALASAQALQPGNPDAQDIASELRPLTARRDAALQAAQTCVAQQSWPCARQHANEALAIDTGSDTAKAILERVIRETGWAPLKTDSPGGSKPSAQSNGSAASPQAQLPTPSAKGMPATTAGTTGTTGTTATTGTGSDTSSADARARSIVNSGWSHATANGAKAAPAPSSNQ